MLADTGNPTASEHGNAPDITAGTGRGFCVELGFGRSVTLWEAGPTPDGEQATNGLQRTEFTLLGFLLQL